MRRFKSAGLCLVAVLAFAAMASGAQAGQIGKCVKAGKSGGLYKGHYLDKYCKTHASAEEEIVGGKQNKYEWQASAVTIPFASEGAASLWNAPTVGEFACERVADEGEFLPGGVKDTDTLTFTGCDVRPFEEPCRSYGAAEKEIKTYPLASQFIDHGEKGLSGKEPAAGEVWEQETAAGTSTDPVFGAGSWVASFECEGNPFVLSGSISGVVEATYVNAKLKAGKAGKNRKLGKPTFKEAFTENGGEQDLQATFVNPLNENKVETDPLVLEFTNDVIISPLEKGLEISGTV